MTSIAENVEQINVLNVKAGKFTINISGEALENARKQQNAIIAGNRLGERLSEDDSLFVDVEVHIILKRAFPSDISATPILYGIGKSDINFSSKPIGVDVTYQGIAVELVDLKITPSESE